MTSVILKTEAFNDWANMYVPAFPVTVSDSLVGLGTNHAQRDHSHSVVTDKQRQTVLVVLGHFCILFLNMKHYHEKGKINLFIFS